MSEIARTRDFQCRDEIMRRSPRAATFVALIAVLPMPCSEGAFQ